MKRKLSVLLSLLILLGSVNAGFFRVSAMNFAYDMSYFQFSDMGVNGESYPEYAGDGDAQTSWSTAEAQKPGMKFVIDMMKIQDVGKIILYQPSENYPAKYNVYVTKYKENWGEPVLTNISGSAGETTEINFSKELSARFIMIELADGTEENEQPWVINEMDVLFVADASKELKETVVTANTDAEDAAEALSAKVKMLNGMDIDITGGDDAVTKAVFLEWLLKFADKYEISNSFSYDNPSFTDIPGSSPYFNMVEYAVMSGIIKGEGAFNPSKNIEVSEAAQMAVNILGYGEYVRARNGGGYAEQAARLGITDGMKASSGELTEKDMVTLLINLLDIQVAELPVDGSSYSITDTQMGTAGDLWRGIYKASGIVTANENTNISGNNTTASGKISVEGTVYNIGETNADELLGYRTQMYVKDLKGQDDDLILAAYKYKNKFIEIPAANLDKAENGTVSYCQSSLDPKSKNARLSDNFNMVYNGIVMIPNDISKINIKSGTVTLIDNNSDSSYDFVSVNEYVDYYVSYLNQTNNIIYDKYSSPILNLGAKNNNLENVKYFKNGERVEFSAIKTGNIVSVAADKTVTDSSGYVSIDTERSQVYTVYISDVTISGTVTAVDTANSAVEIDGRKHKLNSTFMAQCEKGFANIPELSASITAYLDCYGEIGAFETLAGEGWKYGYVRRIFYNFEEDKVFIKMFLQTGETKTLNLAEKINVDGEKYEVNESFLNWDFFYKPDANSDTGYSFEPQLIMYKCNDEGEVNNIDTKAVGLKEKDKEDTIRFYPRSTYEFNTYRNMLYPGPGNNNPNFVTNSVLIFVVPATESYRDHDDYYRIEDKSYFKHDNHYDMEVYKKTDFNEVSVAVIYKDAAGGSSVGGDSNIVMVNKVKYTLDPNEEAKYCLLGTNGRDDLVMYFKDEKVLVDAGLMSGGKVNLHKGDVVQLTDTNGSEIWGISRICDVENPYFLLKQNGRLYSEERTTVGQVYDANRSYMMITSKYLADDERAGEYAEVYPIPSGVVYDQSANEVRKATPDDIKAYVKSKDMQNTSIVIINTVWGEVKWCIIYNLENFALMVSDD